MTVWQNGLFIDSACDVGYSIIEHIEVNECKYFLLLHRFLPRLFSPGFVLVWMNFFNEIFESNGP